ncbi:outer membrane beta-barrel protein [Shewanella algae]|uniref:outer membrane beta-barrel protein n=1 Tax=Shewanella algae TaxID=38313 RepID=UPI001AAC851D|nr:outer membrane beta-barrel protein [Shewanella algae]MBO2687345.1 outer membrane beta-barrel protein [Shewanella algae]
MKINGYCILFVLITLYINSSVTSAKEVESSGKDRAYIGASLGYTFNRDTCSELYLSCDDNDTSYGAFIGVNFTDYLALEIGYQDFGSYEGVFIVADKTEISGVDVALKGTWVFSNDASLFFKAGGLRWSKKFYGHQENYSKSDEYKENGFSPTVSTGVDYEFITDWQVRFAYQWASEFGGEETQLNQVYISIIYKFI